MSTILQFFAVILQYCNNFTKIVSICSFFHVNFKRRSNLGPSMNYVKKYGKGGEVWPGDDGGVMFGENYMI